MVLHWSLSDSKSSQASRTLLSILPDLSNVVVWMVFTCPLINKTSSPLSYPLGIIPSAPITVGITVTFMLYSFFSSLTRSRYLSLFSPFLILLYGQQNPLFNRVSFFGWLSQGHVVWPRLRGPFSSQNLRSLWVSSSWLILDCA